MQVQASFEDKALQRMQRSLRQRSKAKVATHKIVACLTCRQSDPNKRWRMPAMGIFEPQIP